MGETPATVDARTEVPLLIAFADLSRFASDSRRMGDRAAADAVDEMYERIARGVEAGGGEVVKFMGDAALLVFPEAAADRGVNALLDLKEDVDAWLARRGFSSRLVVKAHFGTAVAGPFGGRGSKRFDVIGQAVNVAATLESRTFAISPQAFRRLSKGTRRRFKKHTPPVVYIPVGDARP